ncbi:hypothetical protein P168DRAFT_78496 [Aspergillus campestris IBT 28561]|uniref:Cytochrome b5 heme-binding domain-containing protein n=1 Tax=Aspergillus campestris (strain IBT 28561) TaxID=1392248 RepID=A0A2I1CQY6_ASPC2|nr:uncharacterized protein P168DRAFT_78496 [Aspergillus campestris IBT 28561]PKY00038.1 hypothetical protein P168DRAFT_78496 [Aspergillus campestris IBT 28561]
MADGGTITPALSPKTLPTSHPANHSDHLVAAYTPTEVAAHNRTSDSWIIIDKNVYNITDFQAEHPGGDRSKFFFFFSFPLYPWVM